MTSVGQVVSSHSLRCGQSSFLTHASIDSRRSWCSSVNSRWLRWAAWSGLITVAVANGSLLSGSGLGHAATLAAAPPQHRVLRHTLWYGELGGRRPGPLRSRRRRRDRHPERSRDAQLALATVAGRPAARAPGRPRRWRGAVRGPGFVAREGVLVR